MLIKQSLFFIFLLLFSISCFANPLGENKGLDEDKVFVRAELVLDKDTVKGLALRYESYLSMILDETYNNYVRQYKLNYPKEKITFKKSDAIKILNKLKRFYSMNFWVTVKGKVKLELKGIDLIDLIGSFPKKHKKLEIKSNNNFKYITLSGDNSKNYVYLASKKGITVLTMGVKVNNIFSYKAPKNTKKLEELLALNNKVKYELYLVFSSDSFLKGITKNPIFKDFKGGVFKSSFNKSKAWNNIELIAFLGDANYPLLTEKLNLLYKQFLPKALAGLEKLKKEPVKTKSNMPKHYENYIFDMLGNSLKEIEITNKKDSLNVSFKTKGVDSDSSKLINISLVFALPAIAIPAYQGYMKRSKEHEEERKRRLERIK